MSSVTFLASFALGAGARTQRPFASTSRGETLIRLKWLFLLSDPGVMSNDLVGRAAHMAQGHQLDLPGVLDLFWLVTGVKQGLVGRGRWFDYIGLAALLLTPITVLIRVLESVKRLPVYSVAGLPVSTSLVLAFTILYVIWAEIGIARTIRRLGSVFDILVFIGIHAGLAIGMAVGFYVQQNGYLPLVMSIPGPQAQLSWREGLIYGARIGMTYMGYVVLVRVAILLVTETVAVRGRRLYSIARLSIYESNRRMWAPWVVTDRIPAGAGIHPLVPPAAPSRRDGPALRRHSQFALLGAPDRHGHDPDAAVAADGYPAADDLHSRLQAGPPARVDLGTDVRLHGARDDSGRRFRCESACFISGEQSDRRSTRPSKLAIKAQEREPDVRIQAI